jgi:hypothetical protein
MSTTSPVASTALASDEHTDAFVMERRYTSDTLPEPRNLRIRVREQVARVMAVGRYSGRWSAGNYRKNEAELMGALSVEDSRPAGAPVLVRYNSPFTPWFMRRNEVMIEIEWTEGGEPSSVE